MGVSMVSVKKVAVVVSLGVLLFAGCGGVKPPIPPIPPTPTPTPTPTVPPGIVSPDKLLHRDGRQLMQPDGFAFDFRGAKDCCNSEDGEPNPKWPLGSDERNAWLKEKGNINDLSRRPGPWRAVPGGEEEFQSIGGGYAEFEGRADLSKWNDAFWNYNDALTYHDAQRDQRVEVGVIDGWGLKGNCHAGDIPTYHPWASANNIQGESHCGATHVDAVQEAWIRKVVRTFGRHGNVIWETCNECSLVPGFSTNWEDEMVAIIRDEEARGGYQNHVVVSNAQRFVASADANAFHTGGGSVQPTDDGKITMVNEYNPEPPMKGNIVAATYCTARNQGVYYWAWRHGMTLTEWLKALGAIADGCLGQTCPHPDFERGHVVAGNPDHLEELGVAFQNVRAAHPDWWAGSCLAGGGTPPGDDPTHAAERWAFFEVVVEALAEDMQRQGICAWAHRRVEIHSLRPDKFWGELHPITTNNGCQNSNPYKNTWDVPR